MPGSGDGGFRAICDLPSACHKYMTLGSFFLQFSHNKYAILSYKGEEKRITSETLHSTDLLPFVCSPIFPDLSHYDYFSKSLRRFSCHHTVTRTPHKGLELLSIQITKKFSFFSFSLLEEMKVHFLTFPACF